ncbi:MAG TPA: methyltransferase domain-containing protein [Prolixibacteraceae bacterium]|nr:methyltransferase domain-containing protein [Prolixibacteraceae bacterium]
MDDPIGHAIKDYFEYGHITDIKINTNYTEEESIPPSWFFREFDKMPPIEQKALQLCKGKILDVGAGAGSHTLYLQQNGKDVTALEKSGLAVEVMKKRGAKNVIYTDLYDFNAGKFDTILVLMNGTGLGGTLSGLKKMLLHFKSLLQKNGQILIDSSDIKYLFEDKDGSYWIDLNSNRYYGEMDYEVSYKSFQSKFKWLFTGFDQLQKTAAECSFNCDCVKKGSHFDFLAKLTVAFDSKM